MDRSLTRERTAAWPLGSRGCFVTGTDTGVGKTVVSAAILAALRARDLDALGLKPVLSGVDDPPDPVWPADHELLAEVAGARVEEVNALAFGPPVSPHLAAELSGRPIDPDVLLAVIRDAGAAHEALVVEGVGGLLVPLTRDYMVCDLARAIGLPVVVVARAGLGTINHTLLTLEAARRRGLEVACVVLNRWPGDDDVVAASNRETIAQMGAVTVATFPELERPEPALLAGAGEALLGQIAPLTSQPG